MTISDATRDRVATKYVLGIKTSQIAKDENISEKTVNNIVEEFCSDIGGSKSVKLLLKAMRQSKMSVKDYVLAVRLFQLLKRYADAGEPDAPVDLARLIEITDVLESFFDACSSKLLDPVENLRIAKEIKEISSALDVSPLDLPEKVKWLNTQIRQLGAKFASLTIDVEELEQKKAQAEREADEVLRKHRIVFENLENYEKAKEKVAKHGVNLDEHIGPMAEFIADTEAKGVDPGYVIPKLKRQAEMDRDDEKHKQKRLEQFEMERRVDLMARQEAMKRANELRLLDKMRSSGMTDDQIDRYNDAVIKREKLSGRPAPLTFEDVINVLEQCNETLEKGKATTANEGKDRQATAVASVPQTVDPSTKVESLGREVEKSRLTEVARVSVSASTAAVSTSGSGTVIPPPPDIPVITSGYMSVHVPTEDPYLYTPTPTIISGSIVAAGKEDKVTGSGCHASSGSEAC